MSFNILFSSFLISCINPTIILIFISNCGAVSSYMATPRLARLPRWISHWLGYRPEAVKPLSKYEVALWSFITSFCGLSVVQAIFNYSDYFTERNVPGIIASYVSVK
jgi:hypothetical protein